MTPESFTTIETSPSPVGSAGPQPGLPAGTIPPQEAELTTIDFKPRRRRGPVSKIAQLPGHLRMLINQLLDQDKTYEQVVEEMAKHGVQLNTANVSNWCTGPYQEYLAALDWQDELHQLRDHAYSFTADGDVRFQEGVVQIGLTQVFRDIKEGRFKDDPANSLRLLNSLARLSREALVIRKYADQSAKQQAVALKQLDEDRDLNDNESLLLVNRMDRLFRRKVGKSFSSSCSSSSSSGAGSSSSSSFSSSSSNESPTTPAPPQPEPLAAPQSKIKNQKSKIKPKAPVSKPPSASEPPAAPASPSGTNPPIHQSINPAPSQVGRVTPLATSKRHPDGPPPTQGEPPTANHEPRTTNKPQIINRRSKIEIPEERCHCCRKYLPPRLPSGRRPFDKCQICGTALRPLELLHLFCPDCGGRLDQIFDNDHRTSNQCPHCFTTLPDDAPDPPSAAA